MKSLLATVFQLLLLAVVLPAQVVTTEPVFPRESIGEVVVYFNAAEGDRGLMDCNCDVYLHTGVVTSKSPNAEAWRYVFTEWGQANPDWKMERVPGQSNLYRYRLSPSIRARYGVASDEDILRMAFVFRDASGGRSGRDVGGKDIFYDVFSDDLAFSTILQQPAGKNNVVARNESLTIEATASTPSTFKLYENGTLVMTAIGTDFSDDYPFPDAGNYAMELEITDGVDTDRYPFNVVVPSGQPPLALPEDRDLGATLVGDTLLQLALYAPGKRWVFVLCDFNGFTPDTAFQLRPTPDGDIFWGEIRGLQPGQPFRYQYLVDENLVVADPYSTLILDPDDDPFIPESVFPGLPDYPDGMTAGNVSLLLPGAPQYQWASNDFQRPAAQDLVIYELLLRDFVSDHSYATLIDTLDYLDRLGVNAIELLPVNEFEGNISWGYNPSFHSATDKYYGPPEALKRFVDSCHARGIAVIMDVVYNHAFSQSPLAQLYWDAAASRPAPDNPYLNPIARHPFNVGHDFNHQSQPTKHYVKHGLKRWLQEFRFDGFRFDLSKGFTQNFTSDVGLWSRYDASRIAILKEYADFIWSQSAGAYVILEHFAENREETELSDYGMLLWAGGIHDEYKEAAMGYASDLTGAYFGSRGWTQPNLISYMESHDEERMVFKNKAFGNGGAGYEVQDPETALERAALAAAFFYTIPGPKMLWQFGELGYDFSINYCPNGSSSDGCRTDPKPIRWDYRNDADRRKLFNVMRELILLKRDYEVFRTTDLSLSLSGYTKTIHLRHPDMDVAVVGNFDVEARDISNPFPHGGEWFEYFSGESLSVANPAAPLRLPPGAYRLYTTRAISRPGQGLPTSAREVLRPDFNLQLVPNPAAGAAQAFFTLESAAEVRLEIVDALGRLLSRPLSGQRFPAGIHVVDLPAALAPGQYVVKIVVGNGVQASRLIVVGR